MTKVYVVMVGYDYEGYTDLDMKVFINKEKAEEYAQLLRNDFNYVDVIEREVE
jgi:hypothetical protein